MKALTRQVTLIILSESAASRCLRDTPAFRRHLKSSDFSCFYQSFSSGDTTNKNKTYDSYGVIVKPSQSIEFRNIEQAVG